MNAARPLVLMSGVGAVGAYFGGRLAAAGQAELRVICRSDYEEVAAHGYSIASPNGDFHFQPSRVYRSAAECADAPDYLIITSKVLPGINQPAIVGPAVGPHTTLVLIQNGIDIEKDLARAFPHNELISGIAYVGVTRIAPGKIVHTDGGTLKFGRYPQGESESCRKLTALFNAAQVGTEYHTDMQRIRWEKLLWNAPFNPVSVLLRANTSQIMNDPKTVELIRTLMHEIIALAAADGWPLPEDNIDKLLKYTAGFRPYKPSMLIDFEHGRPMEVEAIVGNALAAGERLGVATPGLKTIYALLQYWQKNTAVTAQP